MKFLTKKFLLFEFVVCTLDIHHNWCMPPHYYPTLDCAVPLRRRHSSFYGQEVRAGELTALQADRNKLVLKVENC